MSLIAEIDLKDLVRTIPDYPKPGIMFRDITTLLGHANGCRACVERSRAAICLSSGWLRGRKTICFGVCDMMIPPCAVIY